MHVLIACAATTSICLMPTFIYNAVRTGSFWRPATAVSAYLESNNAVGGNVIAGLFGLIASPNRGLLMFSPICLLLLAIPFVWRRLGDRDRSLLSAFGTAALLYAVFIATLKNWGAFGWGPRYLVPVLPIAFCGSIAAGSVLWSRYRTTIAALAAASAVLSLAPVFVNWSVAIVAFPGALDPTAAWPHQQIAVLRELGWGIIGKPLPVPAEMAADAVRSAGVRFPDFWIARLIEQGSSSAIAGIAVGASLFAGCVFCAMQLMKVDV
jgi:hypothetical protein